MSYPMLLIYVGDNVSLAFLLLLIMRVLFYLGKYFCTLPTNLSYFLLTGFELDGPLK
jgi:hypothetical protein